MDQSYLGSRQKKWPIPLFVTMGVIIVGGVIFFFATRKSELVSPVPKQPSFEVVFYTPTPGVITPTFSPSATPKVKSISSPLPKPTKGVTPSVKPSPSPTTKPSPSPTP